MDRAADMTDACIDARELGAPTYCCSLSASHYIGGVLRVRKWRKDWPVARLTDVVRDMRTEPFRLSRGSSLPQMDTLLVLLIEWRADWLNMPSRPAASSREVPHLWMING